MLFFRRTDPKLILLIELQSSLIRGSVVRYAPQGISIEASQVLEMEYRGDASGSYVKSALSNVSVLVDSIMRTFLSKSDGLDERIGTVHFVLSSPWTISQAKTISISFEKDTPITEERVRKILEAERPNTGLDPGVRAEIIEEKVFDVRLNGYSVAEWKGKNARTAEIAYALSVGSAESLQNFRQAVSHIADSKHVHFHSSLLLQYMSIRHASMPGDPYMLIHIHGELTDIVAVKRGMCSFFGSFPVGSDTIVRKIAASRKLGKNAADSLLSLYVGGHMEASEEAKVGSFVHHMMAQWIQELSQLDAAMGNLMPASVFLIVHSHEELFDRALRTAYPQAAVQKLSVDMTSTYASAISVIS